MRNGCPDDYMEPNWRTAGRVHEWMNYIPEPVKARWLTLSEETRFVAACVAQMAADREEWD